MLTSFTLRAGNKTRKLISRDPTQPSRTSKKMSRLKETAGCMWRDEPGRFLGNNSNMAPKPGC